MRKECAALALSAALIALPTSSFAQDDAPRVFKQSGAWSLDYGDDYCQLAAAFADGEDQISLAMERAQAENSVRLILVGDAIRTFRAADEIGYQFAPSGNDRAARYIKSETPDGQSYFNLGLIHFGPDPMQMFGPGADAPNSDAPPPAAAPTGDGPPAAPPYNRSAEAAFAEAVTGISLSSGLLSPIQLDTGKMKGPLQALQSCMDDLLQSWGLDPAKHQSMTQRAAPIGPAFEWVPNGTIGFQDFGAFGGARNSVRVMIDAEGKPSDCHIHWPSLSERKNKAICKGIMKKGAFTPARDGEGKAMASYWTVDPAFGLTKPFGT